VPQIAAKAPMGSGSSAQARGLALIRILLGVFFIFEAIGKYDWLADAGVLNGRLDSWAQPGAAPMAQWYLANVAKPGAFYFARLVPLGELATGIALVLGVATRPAALLAFLMVLNFHVASSAIFRYAFLTNGYGLPVLSGLLGLAIGGARLPWSIRK
jgi:uncharacterized membrane protein YphA (DoxX/SURF4 family)